MSPAAFVAVDELYAGIFEHFADRRNVVGDWGAKPDFERFSVAVPFAGGIPDGCLLRYCDWAWYLLRTMYHAEAKVTLAKGPGLAAVLVPVQLFFGHLNGRYVGKHQPSKMAAIEARWNDEKPASEVLIAWPDVENRRNLYAITLPTPFGSLIDSDSLIAGEVGLNSIPRENWPPVPIPFFTFRIMVGCGLAMLALALARVLLEPQRSHRAKPLRALACLSQLPTALHCHPHRLVHGGGGSSALGGLWRLANSRGNDAVLGRRARRRSRL
jgi:Cytochrome bd terminal oxidase subunit I/Cytochrome bd terminal oxidase subunit II